MPIFSLQNLLALPHLISFQFTTISFEKYTGIIINHDNVNINLAALGLGVIDEVDDTVGINIPIVSTICINNSLSPISNNIAINAAVK